MGKFLKVAGDDLILHVRHGVWLGAAPDKAESDKSKVPSKTRAQRLKDAAGDEDFEPDMPDAGDAAYLLDHFYAVGPSMGEDAITSGELRNYQDNMGISLSPWECKTLRSMSAAYLNESHRATNRDCPAPWQQEAHASIARSEIAKNLEDSMRELIEM